MKNIAFLTSRSGGMVKKLNEKGIIGDVYSNKYNEKLEQRCTPIYFKALDDIPTNYDIYLLCGFMKIIPEIWLENKVVINYHPGTQNYKGIDPQKRMLNDYKEGKLIQAGGFIHFVDAGIDTGKVIYEFSENIKTNDDITTLTERMEIKAIDFLVDYLK